MKSYYEFIYENAQSDEDWKLVINISKIWKQYENKQITIVQFNDAYINFLKNNQNIIQERVGEAAWQKLNEIISRLEEKKENEEESNSVWDDIYDWGDSNLIEIKAEAKTDF